MPYLVVLQFRNHEDLDMFYNVHNDDATEGFVMGEYYLPSTNTYCRCNPKTRVRGDNWKRHAKYGLFVCKVCGKPSKAWRMGFLARLGEALGKNQRPV
jgi:hypothetical protein